jgi:dihydroorotase
MTLGGFRHFVAEPAASRVLAFISTYLVGGLEGHLYPDLYGPSGVNVDHTVRAIEENRDLVKGIKAHAELGGASRWGLEVIKQAKQISNATGLPLYIHLGRLWPDAEGHTIDADELIAELVPLLTPGDVLAHPFTRHPGGFVSSVTGEVHPFIWEAIERGILVDVVHGSHFSFDMARRALGAGIVPYTLGADLHGYNVRVPQPGMSADERAQNPFHGVAPFNLTIAMSELLALGVSMSDVVASVTSNAAKLIQADDSLGSIAPGRCADISVLRVMSGPHVLSDNGGEELLTEQLIVPRFCLKGGVLFEADSPFVPPPIAAQ